MTTESTISSRVGANPLDPVDAPCGVEAYAWFVRRAEDLLRPLIPLMREGCSAFALEGRVSSHGKVADRLEAFARPMLLAALWLQAETSDVPREPGADGLDRDAVAAWLREAMRLGADPESDEYWGNLTNYHQHAVEMAIMAMALEESQDVLWNPLDERTKWALASWMGQIRGHAGHANNHWFFDVLTLEFLNARGLGEPGDDSVIARMLDELETMHRAGGWFIDGCNETYDHYNAFSFHTYGLFWARRYGARDPGRRRRWLAMAHDFVESYASLFAASGEHVPIGRSLTYRFNAASVFPLAAAVGVGTLSAGELRRLTRKSIEFFSDAANEHKPMPVGWTDHFEDFAEPYSCEASPYWASKVFFALTLAPTHAFFAEEEQPTASEGGHAARVIDAPGWVVRHTEGESEIISAGVRCSPSAADRFGAWKWGRLSVRTGQGWLTPGEGERYPADASLTARAPGVASWFGRQVSIPVSLTSDHASCVYALGGAQDEFHVNVRTSMWWNAGWIFALHRVRCRQPAMLRQGGFAIPASAGGVEIEVHSGFARVCDGGLHASMQVVAGFDEALLLDVPGEDHGRRRHLTSGHHAVAVAYAGSDAKPLEGEHTLAVLFGSTRQHQEATPWMVEQAGNGWALTHPCLGEWGIPASPCSANVDKEYVR